MSEQSITYDDEAGYLDRLDQDAAENLGQHRKPHEAHQPELTHAPTSSVERSERPSMPRSPPVVAQEWSAARQQATSRDCPPPQQEATSRERPSNGHENSRPALGSGRPLRPAQQHDDIVSAEEIARLGLDPDFLASLPRDIVLEIVQDERRARERAAEAHSRTEACIESASAAPAAPPPRDEASTPSRPRRSQDIAAPAASVHRTPQLPPNLPKYEPPAPPDAEKHNILEILEAALMMSTINPPPLHDPPTRSAARLKRQRQRHERQRRPKKMLTDAVLRLDRQRHMDEAEVHRMYRVAMSRATESD